MILRSREMKVKHFDSDDTYIDDDINEWLEANDVDIIDIKFTTTVSEDSVCNDALLIYKERY
ncbi:sporulation protein Cse60 [Evansella tamaricis]|uniref:Sporulation protein Cse60 n=1 Tax=Evansella tamaricis TaxID=2069301 RepID=A0ABS6JHN2_9BACI|nr:sporulation protein Cse60 [Evansella tamaricis]MBU9712734.1 sporulation protein Cse60 [Evansella tamaricis]